MISRRRDLTISTVQKPSSDGRMLACLENPVTCVFAARQMPLVNGVPVPDELVLAVATALTAKGAELLVDAGRSALAAMRRLVRSRFAENTADVEVLAAAAADPDNQARQAELAAVLSRVMSEDPAFAATVRAQWRLVEASVAAPGHVSNQFDGTANKVVQARDVHGDIHL
ncbi:hypothetical protein ACI2K4_29235 [Micromonospora sp. NPDC050397]|uniref:hypothetical protein n=1 Tax=Micromonospora sp. NPDC050397 TaxID=3364279 RepID=UPI00384F42A9